MADQKNAFMPLRHTLPGEPVDQLPHGLAINPILLSQTVDTSTTGVLTADRHDIIPSQDGPAIEFPWNMGEVQDAPTLTPFIVLIVLVCALEEMRAIAARGIVARMASVELSRIFSVLKVIGDSVRSQVGSLKHNLAVPSWRTWSTPLPAVPLGSLAGGFINVSPEAGHVALCEFWHCGKLWLGHLASFQGSMFTASGDDKHSGPSRIITQESVNG